MQPVPLVKEALEHAAQCVQIGNAIETLRKLREDAEKLYKKKLAEAAKSMPRRSDNPGETQYYYCQIDEKTILEFKVSGGEAYNINRIEFAPGAP